MKILMFNYEYPPLGGGGGVFNKQLAEELAKNGHMVTVITSNYNSQRACEIVEGVKVIRVPVLLRSDQNAAGLVSMLSYFPASLVAGHKQLSKERYDLIHTMFAVPSAPSALALSKHFKIPHLLSILGGDIYDPSKKLSPHKTPLLHTTVKRMIEGSDKVVALSYDIKSRAIEYYKVSKKIDIVHLGIPEPEFSAKSRDDFGFRQNDILLITVGRLVARKGLEDLIEIVKKLDDKKIKLILVGDGPEKTRLQNLASEFDIHKQICFMGYVSDETKFQLLSIADVYVSTSKHEGFGIVFLEAMATGLPVICYDKGGQTEFLKNSHTGYLVTYGNKDLFQKQLKKMCDDNTLRVISNRFNKNYIKEFFIETCAERYKNLYHSLIKNTP